MPLCAQPLRRRNTRAIGTSVSRDSRVTTTHPFPMVQTMPMKVILALLHLFYVCLTRKHYVRTRQAAAKNKSSRYASEDDTRPSESPDSELRKVITAVQRGIRGLQMANAKEPKTSEDLANTGCALLNKDLSPVKYTLTAPRRSPRRT